MYFLNREEMLLAPAPAESMSTIKGALGENYLPVVVTAVLIDDQIGSTCTAQVKLSGKTTVTGEGVGQIDAIFDALKSHYSEEYQSLKSIKLSDLSVRLDRRTERHYGKADTLCRVSLEVLNSRGFRFEFSNSSRSLAASSALAVAAAVEFFINSERAFVFLHRALMDAKERNRQDLVQRYTQELATVVESTSYTDTIERLSKEVDFYETGRS